MKITLKKAGILGVLGATALGVMSVSAMGFGGMMNSNLSAEEIASRQSTMFTEQASLIGVTQEEVKNAWAEGKSFITLATEKGVTKEQLQAKMKARALELMKTQLSALVSKGIITQAQADKRLATLQSKGSSVKNGGMHGMHSGTGKGMGGFGF